MRLNRKTDAQHNFHVSVRVSLGVTFAHVLMEAEEKAQVSFLVLHHVFVGSFLTDPWLTTKASTSNKVNEIHKAKCDLLVLICGIQR